MSKRSKKAALNAYPVEMEYRPTQDVNEINREIYEEGYEKAENDTLERALGVLKNYCDTRKLYEGAKVKLLQFFRKEMEKDDE